ncbi:Ribonuclease TTHA0252 [uncultured Clostridium sp.]|uniref:MBL fold metallo-hydrolase n=1 Tax=uncultured Clostridium sp. TaxID=59620 RepID=UPI0008203082|nr:MBL fold metallo-hydrolase [uncultured Clostridium sp.]SCI98701.1 Ribonuclease TTHA0252 [uncultured Clostridium sp.]
MIKLYSLGGSGENGRNCYAIEWSEGAILLDCGVKREINENGVGDYPVLTKELVSKLKFVLLSHAHEDHSASLPLVYSMGYRGKVYASSPTANSTLNFINKWKNFVKDNNGRLPFNDEDIASVDFGILDIGLNTIDGINITVGRSGHVVGGIWFIVTVEGKEIFYSGDIVSQSMLLHNDKPSKVDAAILNCAYAGKILKQAEQYKILLNSIKETLSIGGKAILPLPQNGRGCDIYKFLSENIKDVPLYVDKEIIDSYNKLSSMTEWVKNIGDGISSENIVSISTMEEREEVCLKDEAGIILTQDGMLTAVQGKYYFERLKEDEKNKVIITGHAAKGTIGAEIFNNEYAQNNSVKLQKGHVIFKVHFDDADVVEFNEYLKAKTIILFHSNKEKTANVISNLDNIGVSAMCLSPGESYNLN